MALPQLSGHIDAEVVDREAELQPLHDEIERLEGELRKMRQERDKARADGMAAISAVSALREQLSGLYRALRAIFGEIDLVAEPEMSVGRSEQPSQGGAASAAWDAWKSRLGVPCGKIITALQLHRSMNQAQIAIATRIDRRNVPTYLSRINKAGLINKNGNEYSLKVLPE